MKKRKFFVISATVLSSVNFKLSGLSAKMSQHCLFLYLGFDFQKRELDRAKSS